MKPLVSILIHNYNYGRYLWQCLNTVFSQRYDNIEVVFADNDSNDDSWKIALEFAEKYPGRMMLIRQSRNRGAEYNSHTVSHHINGDYFVRLCSDDMLCPGFINRTITALEEYKNAAFAMVHRSVMDEKSNLTEEIPFYNRSCVIPGREQAKVYMMSSVTPCISQVMYRTGATRLDNMGLGAGSLTSRWFGPRIQDFNLCFVGDVIYIKEPLVAHRVHKESDSSEMLESMVEPIGQYLLIHQLASVAESYGAHDVAARLPEAIKKVAELCLRYAVGSSLANIKNDELSARYGCLAGAFHFETMNRFTEKHKFATIVTKAEYIAMSRTESYDPPEGSVDL